MFTNFDFTCHECGSSWSTKRWYPDLDPHEDCFHCKASVLADGVLAEGGFEEGEPPETLHEQYIADHELSARLHS